MSNPRPSPNSERPGGRRHRGPSRRERPALAGRREALAFHMASPGSGERMEVLLLGDYRSGHQLLVVRAPRALGLQPEFEAVQAWLLIMEHGGWQVGRVRPTVGFNGGPDRVEPRPRRGGYRMRPHVKVSTTSLPERGRRG